MKKNSLLFLVPALLILVIGGYYFAGKQSGPEKKEQVEESNTAAPANENVGEFSIGRDGAYLTVGEYEEPGVLLKLFGLPVSEEVKVLGPGADTFTGSFVKKVKYSDFEITFMSPKGDGKKFWILDMKTNSAMYHTKRGVKAGDSVEDLLKAYPNINIVQDGRTDKNNCAYELNENRINFVMFEAANGKITEIKLFRELP